MAEGQTRFSDSQGRFGDSSAISNGVAVLLIAVTTPVRALVQTGEPPNLAREGDPIGRGEPPPAGSA